MGAPRVAGGSGRLPLDRLALFSLLWALAVLLHQASYAEWAADPCDLALSILAAAVVVRPFSLALFALLLACQILDVALELPWVSNHWLFAGVAAATVLAALAVSRRGPAEQRRKALFAAFAPWVRLELLLLYGFAFLHKLNSAFLDPATSCAAVHADALLEPLGLAPQEWASRLVIYATLAVEAGVPALLLLPRTRLAGILVGSAFHGAIGLNLGVAPFYNFSSVVFACYALFLPEDFVAALRRRLGPRALGWAQRLVAAAALLLLAAGLAALPAPAPDLVRGLWAAYTGAWMGLVLLGATRSLDRRRPRLVARPAFLALFPALLLVNGLSPYLGLKTETSFAMFSNLRTEGKLGNHLFLAGAPRVASYQDGLVKVLDSSDPDLRRLARSPLLFVFFELRDFVSRRPEASLRYLRNGRVHVVPRIGDDPELSHPPPALARKLLLFRLVDPRGRCRH